MTYTNTLIFYRLSTPQDMKVALTNIMDQIERYGYAITENSKASQLLSRYLSGTIHKDNFYFVTDASRRKSFVILNHHVKAKKIGVNKIELTF